MNLKVITKAPSCSTSPTNGLEQSDHSFISVIKKKNENDNEDAFQQEFEKKRKEIKKVLST